MARPSPFVVVLSEAERVVLEQREFGVEPICTALQVAPSTYYAAKARHACSSARAARDAVMARALLALWVANRKVYGAHKRCGRRPAAPVTTSAGTRSPG